MSIEILPWPSKVKGRLNIADVRSFQKTHLKTLNSSTKQFTHYTVESLVVEHLPNTCMDLHSVQNLISQSINQSINQLKIKK